MPNGAASEDAGSSKIGSTDTENRMKTELFSPHTKVFVDVYHLRQAQAALAELVEAKNATLVKVSVSN